MSSLWSSFLQVHLLWQHCAVLTSVLSFYGSPKQEAQTDCWHGWAALMDRTLARSLSHTHPADTGERDTKAEHSVCVQKPDSSKCTEMTFQKYCLTATRICSITWRLNFKTWQSWASMGVERFPTGNRDTPVCKSLGWILSNYTSLY